MLVSMFQVIEHSVRWNLKELWVLLNGKATAVDSMDS